MRSAGVLWDKRLREVKGTKWEDRTLLLRDWKNS